MNALEMLQVYLQRASSGGSVFDRLRGATAPDAQDRLEDLSDWLPAQDELIGVPGQGGRREQLHPNALGIYGREARPTPAGDQVLRGGQPGIFAWAMPLVAKSGGVRAANQQAQPSYFPGSDGFTRISAGQSLARGLPQYRPPPSPDTEGEQIDPALRQAMGMRGGGIVPQQLPPGLPLVVQDAIRNQPAYQEGGQTMAPEPYYAPNIGEPVLPREDPGRRDYRLNDMIGFGRYMKEQGGWAWPENQFPTTLEPGQSPYANRLPSALNQLMRRLPYGQY